MKLSSIISKVESKLEGAINRMDKWAIAHQDARRQIKLDRAAKRLIADLDWNAQVLVRAARLDVRGPITEGEWKKAKKRAGAKVKETA